MTNNTFWFNDITILLKSEYLNEFMPTIDMTTEQKLNSIVRFCIYLAFLLILFTNNINYIFLVIVGLLITYYVYIFNIKSVNNKEVPPPTNNEVPPTNNEAPPTNNEVPETNNEAPSTNKEYSTFNVNNVKNNKKVAENFNKSAVNKIHDELEDNNTFNEPFANYKSNDDRQFFMYNKDNNYKNIDNRNDFLKESYNL